MWLDYNIDTQLSKIETAKISWKIFSEVSSVANAKNPEEARLLARESVIRIYNEYFKQLWIKVSIKFSHNAISNFPSEVYALEKYIETWEILSYIPLLFLWNHQAYWLEAVWAYHIFPTNWRIQLKDLLWKIPFFWKWINALNSIIFDRKNWLTKEFAKKRNEEIVSTLDSWKSVLIYPEWTRSRDWNLWSFSTSLFKPAYDYIQKNSVNKVVCIISSSTDDVFPDTFEKSLFCLSNAKKWEITYVIDFIDSSVYENIKTFSNDVEAIIWKNIKW